MTCPYCGIEMTEGYIRSGYPIHWFSGEKDSRTMGEFNIQQNGFVNSIFNGNYRTGHFCPECKKIILSVE